MVRRKQSASNPVTELFEACEQRLVFSAQPLFDLLVDSPNIYPQLAEAHQTTGNDWVQQEYGLTGAGQTVAVIDSGIAWDHHALGQGFGADYRVVGGWDFAENDAQPYDDGPAGFHGTHVSGIIGGDYPGNSGVAREVDLVALRVFDDSGAGKLEWVESALEWVYEHRNAFENPITTVNLSVGTLWSGEDVPGWGSLEDELQLLHSANIFVTAAAGNNFENATSPGLSYPATSSYVVPVASMDSDGELSSFSQRTHNILAAPGDAIRSSVPDHVLGRDGRVDDFTTSSGTSMSAPYLAGASVLVRQAMEMAGWESITTDDILSHLRSTADTQIDATTGFSYLQLDLQAAIDALVPTDQVGDNLQTAQQLHSPWSHSFDSWLNSVDDRDVFQFTSSSDGQWTLDLESDWMSGMQWSLHSGTQLIASGNEQADTVAIQAGRTYEFSISSDSIGPLTVESSWSPNSNSSDPAMDPIALGQVHFHAQEAEAGQQYSLVAGQDGLFTVQWEAASFSTTSELSIFQLDDSQWVELASTSQWDAGKIRLDVSVEEGQTLRVNIPQHTGDARGLMTLAEVVSLKNGELTVHGTAEQDSLRVDLSQAGNLNLQFESLEYQFSTDNLEHVRLEGSVNSDSLELIGSAQIDAVELRPGLSTLENSNLHFVIHGFESIDYSSGGAADRVYMYDSDGDDVLKIYPRHAELQGAGYEFTASDMSRIFVHATGTGNDFAFLHDSSGDDRLSMRPQFTSLSGPDFFNYVRGFERVFAYATQGGQDEARLYDSVGNDRFSANGSAANLSGPGFASYSRGFEEVTAFAGAGGDDLATLYEKTQATWQQGSDFVSIQDGQWQREARSFATTESYAANNSIPIATQAMHSPGSLYGPSTWFATAEANASTAEPTRLVEGEEVQQRLHLPEADVLDNPELEAEVLDLTFSDMDFELQPLFDDEEHEPTPRET